MLNHIDKRGALNMEKLHHTPEPASLTNRYQQRRPYALGYKISMMFLFRFQDQRQLPRKNPLHNQSFTSSEATTNDSECK